MTTRVVVDSTPAPNVRVLRLDGPDRMNAISAVTWRELDRCFREAFSTPSVEFVLLTGTGRAFCAGADVREYTGCTTEQFEAFQRLARDVTAGLSTGPLPVIAVINGVALGGGLELALACDLVVAAADAAFGFPEVKLGLLPGGGGTQRAARLLGPWRTKELLMSGRSIPAHEALAVGLVNRISDPNQSAMEAAMRLVGELASSGPDAVRAAKRLVEAAADLNFGDGLDLEASVVGSLFRSEQGREGIAAFLGKRPPKFSD